MSHLRLRFPTERLGGGGLRLVTHLASLNQYVIRDSTLIPRVDDFAESFAGYICYGCADLFAGFDGRIWR